MEVLVDGLIAAIGTPVWEDALLELGVPRWALAAAPGSGSGFGSGSGDGSGFGSGYGYGFGYGSGDR